MAEGILGEIVARKRQDLTARYQGVAIDSLRAAADRTRRSLSEAIARPGARFILEIKKASPSQGAIRPTADVGAVATAYAPVADALSVLTDAVHFGGVFGRHVVLLRPRWRRVVRAIRRPVREGWRLCRRPSRAC